MLDANFWIQLVTILSGLAGLFIKSVYDQRAFADKIAILEERITELEAENLALREENKTLHSHVKELYERLAAPKGRL